MIVVSGTHGREGTAFGGCGMANGELLLEGEMLVGYVRVLELRKLCGRTTHPRLSVRKADAALCTAVEIVECC